MPDQPRLPPILADKAYDAPSVFQPANLLREARRQKAVPDGAIPEVCVLDPDGDIQRALRAAGRTAQSPHWACYHTELDVFEHAGSRYGLIGCAVGASFAVLLAEQLFASGCQLLISVTSSGQIVASGPTPYFVLIDRALRDEGTSYHYLPPAEFSDADARLMGPVLEAVARTGLAIYRGATWTTDAPFRETAAAIEACRGRGILAVEMEAAALYAFAQVRAKPVICFAHVTNQMARIEGDFEKGEAGGAYDALTVIHATATAFRALDTMPR
ncbi:MAG: nucleoside phosphorylase [Proteobacteria bacterium]|nr:nucleoside phosphorylase [Pseudomonadota bacterium]